MTTIPLSPESLTALSADIERKDKEIERMAEAIEAWYEHEAESQAKERELRAEIAELRELREQYQGLTEKNARLHEYMERYRAELQAERDSFEQVGWYEPPAKGFNPEYPDTGAMPNLFLVTDIDEEVVGSEAYVGLEPVYRRKPKAPK